MGKVLLGVSMMNNKVGANESDYYSITGEVTRTKGKVVIYARRLDETAHCCLIGGTRIQES